MACKACERGNKPLLTHRLSTELFHQAPAFANLFALYNMFPQEYTGEIFAIFHVSGGFLLGQFGRCSSWTSLSACIGQRDFAALTWRDFALLPWWAGMAFQMPLPATLITPWIHLWRCGNAHTVCYVASCDSLVTLTADKAARIIAYPKRRELQPMEMTRMACSIQPAWPVVYMWRVSRQSLLTPCASGSPCRTCSRRGIANQEGQSFKRRR